MNVNHTPATERPLAKAPLYEDPVHHGPADPRLFFNPLERNWWLLYTSRRATHEGPGVEWGFGTAIGAASSADGAQFDLRHSVIQVAEARVDQGRLLIERDHARFQLPLDGQYPD